MFITIDIRSPGDNIPLAAVREDHINDKWLSYTNNLAESKLCNLGEFITLYLQDHPDAQLIIRSA